MVYTYMQEASTNTAFALADIKTWLNEGYANLCNVWEWPFLYTETVKTMVYTACSDAGTSTGTTLYVDSSSNMYVGQKLVVTDGVVYEEVEVSQINLGTITLVSPGLTGSYTDGDVVSGASIQMPTDYGKTVLVVVTKISGSTQEIAPAVKTKDFRQFYVLYSTITSTGMPENYWDARINSSIVFYPAPDFAYKIKLVYTKNPTPLSADGDIPILPAKYHYILVYYALSQCFRKDENDAWAEYYMNLFNYNIAQMRGDYSTAYDKLSSFQLDDDTSLPSFSW